MFDFAWSELGVIAAAALIFIGPKDMPVAIKSITGMIKKARRMASEFQTHVDELVREADLTEVRDQLSELRSYASPAAIEKLIDEDGSIRRSFDDPFKTADSPAASAEPAYGSGDVAVAERIEVETEVAAAGPEPEIEARADIPAFIPPGAVPRVATPRSGIPPAFIPPEFAQRPPLGPAA